MRAPKTCHLSARAQEDLAVLIDEAITTAPELEWAGPAIGYYDERRDRIVVQSSERTSRRPTRARR